MFLDILIDYTFRNILIFPLFVYRNWMKILNSPFNTFSRYLMVQATKMNLLKLIKNTKIAPTSKYQSQSLTNDQTIRPLGIICVVQYAALVNDDISDSEWFASNANRFTISIIRVSLEITEWLPVIDIRKSELFVLRQIIAFKGYIIS